MQRSISQLKEYFEHRAASFQTGGGANGYLHTDASDAALYDALWSELSRLLELRPGHQFLEIGCGTGELLARAHKHSSFAVGIDLAQAMARRAAQKRLSVCLSEARFLPFPSDAFDRVLICLVLINIGDEGIAAGMILEALRVVRRGGRLVVALVPHPSRTDFPIPPDRAAVARTNSSLHRAKRLVRSFLLTSASPTIGYFSYPCSFFNNLCRAPQTAERITFSWSQIQRDKYHVSFEKA